MLNSIELIGYRVEKLEGDRFSLQLFGNGVLIYKTYELGVRDGTYQTVECYSVKGTAFWKDCQSLIKKYRFRVFRCPEMNASMAMEEALVCCGDVFGSLFLHGSPSKYTTKELVDYSPADLRAVAGDFADAFVSVFFKTRSTLSKLEKSEYVDYVDPFIEETANRLRLHAEIARTEGYEKTNRPCLNSFHLDPYHEKDKAYLEKVRGLEDYLDQNLLKTLLQARSQEDFDGKIHRLLNYCKQEYSFAFLYDSDYELYLSKLVLAFALKGQIKSCSIMRWLRPDYRDVIAWHGDKGLDFCDYFVPLKYYRWKSQKEKQLPLFFYLWLQAKNETDGIAKS